MNYSEKLRDPRWQKKRLEILERDEFTCQHCMDKTSTLHVHHKLYYKGLEPWEYNNMDLITLCESCHQLEEILILKQKGVIKRLNDEGVAFVENCVSCADTEMKHLTKYNFYCATCLYVVNYDHELALK